MNVAVGAQRRGLLDFIMYINRFKKLGSTGHVTSPSQAFSHH